MTRSITRFCLICIYLCVPSLIKAQTARAILQEADSLYASGEWQWAKLAYEKAVYALTLPDAGVPADSTMLLRNEALLKKTFCYKATGRFEEALKNIERADPGNLPDSLHFQLRYETALCAYLAKHYNEAYNYILQTRYLIKDTVLISQLDFLEILTLNELMRWEEAKQLLATYIRKHSLDASADEIYAFLKNPKIRNVEKAVVLSTFLPGVGQMYAGYPFRGMVSATLQLACFTFGAYSIWKGYYLSGFFTGFVLLQTFYSGGIRHTRQLAEKKNQERISRYNNQVKAFILQAERERLE